MLRAHGSRIGVELGSRVVGLRWEIRVLVIVRRVQRAEWEVRECANRTYVRLGVSRLPLMMMIMIHDKSLITTVPDGQVGHENR